MPQNSTPGPQSGSDNLKSTAQEVKAEASAEGEALKEKAKAGLEDARSGALKKSEDVKERAATEISQTSSALRTAAGELDDGSIQHQMFTQAADAVAGVSDALSNHSISEIVDGLSRFGRRNPAALIGGAVLAGLVVSRFVKASDCDGHGGGNPSPGSIEGSAPSGGTAPSAPRVGDTATQPMKGTAHD